MKPSRHNGGTTAHSRMMTRLSGILFLLFLPWLALAQGGDQQLRAKADGLFAERRFAEAMPLYSQLVSLQPADRTLNYRFGTTLLFVGEDKEKAIGHLKYATEDPAIDPAAWYWLGRAYHLNYRFKDALAAYQKYQGVADKKTLADLPPAAMEQQCRNGLKLLSKLKDVQVRNKVEVAETEFFRYYDLSDIGGKIVVTPDELKTALDKKNKYRGLVYLPDKGGAIYFSSYGKDGRTGLDIYRTELMPDGRFATPEKLAGFINTDQDEDHAFLHPDGRTFYFSSKGHSSMGGYDVFRATYDKGMDTFGMPENMDFAVNTPDDDVLYLVDAGQKEACFASGRSSRQGQLHVYRVSTAQTPLVITVLQGTYANELDPNDRKARIVVQDVLTQEQVADVRTDINGSYVLALPRSGRFRFLVDCGPTGKTHSGMVEVPRSDTPKAYRQELTLTKQGDLERLVIRNYFETPLEGDLIALALEEIKRRARLDVSTAAAPVAQAPKEEELVRDVLTQAGFSGDLEKADVVRLAQEDARALAKEADALDATATAAFALAAEALSEADRNAQQAEALVRKAQDAASEEERNATMVEAALLRQRSREAELRANAALRTARTADRDRMAVRQQALEGERLATEVQRTLAAQRDQVALPHLTALKERLDQRAGPTGRIDLAERMRRELTAQEQLSARTLQQANAKRTDEGELTDRVNRLKRELEATKNRSRKEELEREIATLSGQLEALRGETATAYAKARVTERETAALRGSVGLSQHLSTQPGTTGKAALTAAERDALEQRLAGTRQRIEGLAIDERYDALIPLRAADAEARSFAWDRGTKDLWADAERSATRSQERDATADARRMSGTNTRVEGAGMDRELGRAEVAQVPISDPDAEISAGAAPRGRDAGAGADTAPRTAAGNDRPSAQAADARTVTQGDRQVADGGDPAVALVAAGGTDRRAQEDRPTQGTEGQRAEGITGGPEVRPAPSVGKVDTEQNASSGAPGAVVRPVPTEPVGTPEDIRNAAMEAPTVRQDGVAREPEAPEADDPFLLQNELDEVRQLLKVERDRTQRAALQQRIATLEQRLAAAQQAVAAAEGGQGEEEGADLVVDLSRAPLSFDRNISDEALVAKVYADHAADERRLQQLADADARADGLHGLELMLADSLRAEMQRQVAILELDPQQAEVVLPRVERLRKLREARLQRAEEHLQLRQQELLAAAGTPGPMAASARAARPGTAPAEDRFVVIEGDTRAIYASTLVHRSPKVTEAVLQKEADLVRMEALQAGIDSMLQRIDAMPVNRERDREMKRMDRMRDDLLIARTDLGQRSAFLSKEEWATATDSMKVLEKALVRKGLPATEPLLVAQRTMRGDAQQLFSKAEGMRKKADRTEDIIQRDSLYRMAYETELRALREMDRSLTVANYLIGDRHMRGETLAYPVVASRVLGIEEPTDALLTDGRRLPRTDKVADGARDIAPAPTAPVANVIPDAPRVDQEVSADLPAEVNEPALAERPSPAPEDAGLERNAVAERPQEVSPVETVPAAVQVDDAAVAKARQAADREAQEMGARVDPKALTPASNYERFLSAAPSVFPAEADPRDDGSVLALQVMQATERARELEAEAQQLADRATALEDSAATARKRDRVKLEKLAAITRLRSDSVGALALRTAEEARNTEQQLRTEQEEQALRRRLVKFYYLTADEQDMVLDDADRSRYFNARTKALEQYDAAADAADAARTNRELAAQLAARAQAVQQERGMPAVERAERARVLQARADALQLRADSLQDVSRRLRGAAGINEGQASVMMQGLPSEDATRLMALEMRNRRTEPVLAEARGQGGAQPAPQAVPATVPDREATTTVDRMAPVIPQRLVADIFELRAQGANAGAPAIAMDAPMPEGLVFKVQIGAFNRPVPEATFADMTPVMGESVGNGMVRYTAGLFTSFEQAAVAKDKVRGRGYRDAFVVAYRDGRRIPLGEAMREARELAVASTERRSVEARPATEAVVAPSLVAPAQPVASTPAAVTAPAVAQAQPADRTPPVSAAVERPSTVVTATPTPEEELAAIMAKYPPTPEDLVERFVPAPQAAAYYNVPGAAPARQVETIKGLFFTVQVGVYSRPVPLDKIFNITPLNSELTETAKIRYTTGMYLDAEAARVRKDATVQLGVKDAFATAYLNGKRIPMRDAAALLERFGPAILAKP